MQRLTSMRTQSTGGDGVPSPFAPVAAVPAVLVLMQDPQSAGSGLAEALRTQAFQAAVHGLRGQISRETAELEAAMARGDMEAAAIHEDRLHNLQNGLERVEDRLEGMAEELPPGATATTMAPPPPVIPELPNSVVAISLGFFLTIVLLVLGLPIVRALGRRKTLAPVVSVPDVETREQLREIGHAVDAIAIEVERISEGQRRLDQLQGATPPSARIGQGS